MCGIVKSRQIVLLLVFASRVRAGEFGHGREIRVGSVDVALCAVGQTIVLAGYPDPRRSYGHKEFDLPISLLLKKYKESDAPSVSQLAVPVEVVEAIAARPRHDELMAAVNDLVELQFLFLLRVGEYSIPATSRKTRTVQFRRKDSKTALKI